MDITSVCYVVTCAALGQCQKKKTDTAYRLRTRIMNQRNLLSHSLHSLWGCVISNGKMDWHTIVLEHLYLHDTGGLGQPQSYLALALGSAPCLRSITALGWERNRDSGHITSVLVTAGPLCLGLLSRCTYLQHASSCSDEHTSILRVATTDLHSTFTQMYLE